MQQELGQYIASLLYQNNSLSIPNFGSFQLAHEPAVIDQVQGIVAPPSRKVDFNANLVMDDGLLIDHIAADKDLSVTEAKNWIASLVDGIKENLDKREIVELDGVGRFFINFENELKFVEVKENYNTDSFGLKSVEALPIPRVAEPLNKTKKPENKPQVKTGGGTDWINKYGKWLLIGLLGLAILFMVAKFAIPSSPSTDDPAQGIPENRLNASPTKDENGEDARADVAPPSGNEDTQKSEIPDNNETQTTLDTESPTLNPGEQSAVIAVGLFSNEKNAENMIRRIFDAGFEAWSQKEGNGTRVGVQFRYETEKELQATLQTIQKDFEDGAFIMEE